MTTPLPTPHSSPYAPLVGASPVAAVRRFFGRAFHLRGRASLSEYWWWTLIHILVSSALGWLVAPTDGTLELRIGPVGAWGAFDFAVFSQEPAAFVETPPIVATLAVVWSVLTFIPAITLAVRRLHDSDCTGSWLLLLLLGPLGSVILLLMMARASRAAGASFDGPISEGDESASPEGTRDAAGLADTP